MIYVVQAAIGGPIKIGHTSGETVNRRVATLQSACPWPLLILRKIPGAVSDERALHRRFAEQRLHGEWFSPTGPVLAWLQAGHVEIRETVEPQEPALVGPLPEMHGRVVDVLVRDGGWLRASEIASAINDNHMRVSSILRGLHGKYGRVLFRRTVFDGRSVNEWRAYWSQAGLIGGVDIAA